MTSDELEQIKLLFDEYSETNGSLLLLTYITCI